jgi:hypothetical protein
VQNGVFAIQRDIPFDVSLPPKCRTLLGGGHIFPCVRQSLRGFNERLVRVGFLRAGTSN